MRIEIGKYAGFCRGVKRAVDGAFSYASRNRNVFCDGEIIHNPQTLKLLKEHGVKTLSDEEIKQTDISDGTVIIRAHGIPPKRRHFLKSKTTKIVDLTCPDVAKVQSVIKKYNKLGYRIVIYGKSEHPEVVGLRGFADESIVISSEEDAKNITLGGKTLLVSQTTMSEKTFEKISEIVEAKSDGYVGINTICPATEQRQKEAEEMSLRNDIVIVVGGKHSSNTKRLYEIASSKTKAILVSEPEEITKEDLALAKRIGITAGASTPDYIIDECVEQIKSLKANAFGKIVKTVALFGLYSNLFFAISASLLSFAVCEILSLKQTFDTIAIISLYYLSMSLLNSYTNRNAQKIYDAPRAKFMNKHKYIFTAIFLLSIIASAVFAIKAGQNVFILTLFSLTLGVAYNFSYFPASQNTKMNSRLFFFKASNLPAAKSLIISAAVTVLLNGLPILKHYDNFNSFLSTLSLNGYLGVLFSCALVFMLTFTRQALFEIRSVQSDKIAGVSNLLSIVNENLLRNALHILSIFVLLAMLAGVILGYYPVAHSKYFVAVTGNYGLVLLSKNRLILSSAIILETLAEANVVLAGLLSLWF